MSMTNYKMWLFGLLGAVSMLICVSCSPTPASRIADNAELYYRLTPDQRELVKQGRIEKGMPPSAVFLAWGHPSSVAEGNVNGRSTLRWIYTSLQPVFTPTWGGGYWGPFGRPGYWGRGYYGSYYNDVTYVPVNSGYVLFTNNVVDSWEKRDS